MPNLLSTPPDQAPALRQRAVRDLAFACLSPPLLRSGALPGAPAPVSNTGFAATAERLRWLVALDHNPAPLLARLAAHPQTRLGLYFETLWQFFLEQDAEVELLTHNLPVRQAGQTVGEFDCLYYCYRRQRAVHLELAVKYYLHRQDAGCDWDQWLGPNSRDRLDLKLTRLLTHQSQLSLHPAGAALLEAKCIRDPLREVEVKGYLFHHLQEDAVAPEGFNRARSLDTWCYLKELDSALQAGETYRVLPRLEWLAAAEVPAQERLDAAGLHTQLGERFGEGAGAQLVAALGTAGQETRRFFVCPDNWPD
ncbi:DUF1853 family protein [Parahaliea maris]|uniref:DUF1853 family protein n=1 Tax=Parahaliea maris TaxID=2716870 RepID=A0A5C8ZW53_9GAMM|nr:DUF1853 family protein [Parahaliea maris]TXS92785.1 DUF1853 family protein [Parahaliea maris]